MHPLRLHVGVLQPGAARTRTQLSQEIAPGFHVLARMYLHELHTLLPGTCTARTHMGRAFGPAAVPFNQGIVRC